ncbi:MAG: 50S ribosomal protein L1, partial [Deltaproteobacteria bacterium]
MPKRGKKYLETSQKLDKTIRYNFFDGVKIALEASFARFDETVDLAVRLGV